MSVFERGFIWKEIVAIRTWETRGKGVNQSKTTGKIKTINGKWLFGKCEEFTHDMMKIGWHTLGWELLNVVFAVCGLDVRICVFHNLSPGCFEVPSQDFTGFEMEFLVIEFEKVCVARFEEVMEATNWALLVAGIWTKRWNLLAGDMNVCGGC